MSESSPKASLLVIEDDPLLSSNMALMLTMEGFEVRVAADGLAGLGMIRKKRPDLILCDILMPGMDGYAFHEAINHSSALAKIPFLFVSALNEPDQIRKGMAAGADDYLTKPFTAEALLAAVTSRLQRFALLRSGPKERGPTKDQIARLQKITPREQEILHLVARGNTSRDIAETLFISPKTVEVHRSRLMRKLGVANAAALSAWAEYSLLLDQASNQP